MEGREEGRRDGRRQKEDEMLVCVYSRFGKKEGEQCGKGGKKLQHQKKKKKNYVTANPRNVPATVQAYYSIN